MRLSGPTSPTRARVGRIDPGLLVVAFGCLLFIAGWALALSGVGPYLLVPGLALCALEGWLIGGWRGAIVAPLLAVTLGAVLVAMTNATVATWRELRDSDTPVAQTPSPRS